MTTLDVQNAAGRPLQRGAQAAACFVLAMGTLVFFGGWVFGITPLANVIPGTVVMKASTACALGFSGAALLLLIDDGAGRVRRRAGVACALVPLLIGLAFLSEYVVGWNLGIDEFPFRDEAGRADGIAYPGRLAPTTAVNLMLVGLALLTLDRGPRLRWRAAEVLMVPVAVVATMSLIGYLYSIPEFYGPASAAKMALNTATCFIAIALAIIVARPRGRLLSLATTSAPGGMMARRLIPVVILLPLVFGWVHLQLDELGVYSDRVGTWWLTAATVAALLVMLWRGAVRLNKLDEARCVLEGELQQLANHDQLTGLFNRHRFEEELASHARRTRRHGGRTAVIMLDLDGLKEANDKFGHAAGDQLLRGIGEAISDRVRNTDVAARLGGDEFAVLLLESTSEGAAGVAAALLAAARGVEVRIGDEVVRSTISAGVAFADPPLTDDGTILLGRADAAMYEAKRAGGDRLATAMPMRQPLQEAVGPAGAEELERAVS